MPAFEPFVPGEIYGTGEEQNWWDGIPQPASFQGMSPWWIPPTNWYCKWVDGQIFVSPTWDFSAWVFAAKIDQDGIMKFQMPYGINRNGIPTVPMDQFVVTYKPVPPVIFALTVFDEDVEWVFAAPARIVGNSLANPHTGIISILGTNCQAGDSLTLTSPTPIILSNYSNLSIWISPLGAGLSATASNIGFGWSVGNTLEAKDYGLIGSLQTYQNIIFPIKDFGVAANTPVQVLQATCQPKTTFSFYADTFILNP